LQRQNKENNMNKKLLTLVLSALMLGSCTGSKAEDTNKKEKKMEVTQLTKDLFTQKVVDYVNNPKEWKYLGDKPAIIDFYATWCGPCRMVAPIMEELAKEYGDKIVVYKVDVDQEQELAGLFGIQSIPSVLFIPMKGKPTMTQGAQPKSEFVKAINNILLK
jgi:thioredoxin